MSGDRLRDKYKNLDDFEDVLEEARMAAGNDDEEEFVAKVIANYKKYKYGMFWSEAQDKYLRVISNYE